MRAKEDILVYLLIVISLPRDGDVLHSILRLDASLGAGAITAGLPYVFAATTLCVASAFELWP